MVLKHQLICWLEVRDLQEGPVRLSNTIPRVKVSPTGTSGRVEKVPSPTQRRPDTPFKPSTSQADNRRVNPQTDLPSS